MRSRKELADAIRILSMDAVDKAKSGHPGGSLSASDLFTYLYFKEMRVDPQNPKADHRIGLSFPRATPPPDSIPPWP